MTRFAMLVTCVALAACASSRQVDVENAPKPASGMALHVTNTASQPMNVYVNADNTDVLAGRVLANTTQDLPVSGVAMGSTVTLKAKTEDGTKTYSKEGVVLNGTYAWTVP